LSDFDLFISQDSGSPEMISNNDTPKFPLAIRSVVIDHHATNKGYADVNLIDNSLPAVSAILYELFKDWQIKITPEIATNLFMGIYTDTGGFRYPPTNYKIFAAASELTKIAPNYTQTIFLMENSAQKESLAFLGLAMNSIETFANGHLALVSISKNQLSKINIPEEATHAVSVSNLLKSVIGWNISGTIIEREPGKVKCSFRTRDSVKYDVSKLAAALGGGGHRAAAGAKLNMSIEEAKNLVVKKVEELYNLAD
jgi:phosphoesterase RecJ-like protein